MNTKLKIAVGAAACLLAAPIYSQPHFGKKTSVTNVEKSPRSIPQAAKVDAHLSQIKSLITNQKYALASIEIKRLEAFVKQAQTAAIQDAFPGQNSGFDFRDIASDDSEYALFSRAYTESSTATVFNVTLFIGDPSQEEIAQLARSAQDQFDASESVKTIVMGRNAVAVEKNSDDTNEYERDLLIGDSIMIRMTGENASKTQIDRFCELINVDKLQRVIEKQ